MKKLFASRHLNQRLRLERRTFLAAVGLGISAPVALHMSKMAVAAPTGRPTRLFIYFVPHGCPVEHYEPGDNLNLDVGEGILAPFEPYRNHLTAMRGVSNLAMPTQQHDTIRAVLTGADDVHDSIDYLVANQLSTTAHVLGTQSYRANSPGPDHDSKLVRHGAYVTPILNPADALTDLFAGLSASTASPTVDMDAEFRKEAISLTEGEVLQLQQKLSSLTTESNKLQIHLDSLAALKAASSGEGTAISCEARPALPEVEALAGADVFSMNNFAAILQGHLSAVANAFVCGSARVATLQNMYGNAQIDMSFPGGPGVAGNHHDPLSHSLDEAGRTNFAKVQRWFNQQLVDKFISVLDVPDPQDPAHTVLENTTILTCTEICDGNSHASVAGDQWLSHAGGNTYTYLPWNIIGGGGGCFAGGRSVTMQGVDHRQILAAVAHSMGVTLPSVGGLDVSLPSELLA